MVRVHLILVDELLVGRHIGDISETRIHSIKLNGGHTWN